MYCKWEGSLNKYPLNSQRGWVVHCLFVSIKNFVASFSDGCLVFSHFEWLCQLPNRWKTLYAATSLRHFKPLLREDSTYYGLNVLMRPEDGPRTRKGSRTNGLSGLMTSICWSINQQTLWDAKTRLFPIRKSGPKNLRLQLENIPLSLLELNTNKHLTEKRGVRENWMKLSSNIPLRKEWNKSGNLTRYSQEKSLWLLESFSKTQLKLYCM